MQGVQRTTFPATVPSGPAVDSSSTSAAAPAPGLPIRDALETSLPRVPVERARIAQRMETHRATIDALRARAPSFQRDDKLCDAYNDLGIDAGVLGDTPTAERAFRQMAKLATVRQQPAWRDTALLNLADHYTRTPDAERARPLAVAALATSQKRDDADNTSYAYATLGRVELAAGNAAKAVEHLTQALGLADGIPDYWNRADLHSDLARALLAQGRPATALDQANHAVRIADRADTRVFASAALARAEALAATEQPQEAVRVATSVAHRVRSYGDAELVQRLSALLGTL